MIKKYTAGELLIYWHSKGVKVDKLVENPQFYFEQWGVHIPAADDVRAAYELMDRIDILLGTIRN
jgi:hypothetical protein